MAWPPMGEEKQKGVLRGLPDVDLYSCGMRSLTDLVEFFCPAETRFAEYSAERVFNLLQQAE